MLLQRFETRRVLPLLAVCLGVLSACGGDSAAVDSGPATEVVDEDSALPQPEAVAPAALIVDGEGLRLIDAASGSTTPLPFGTAGDAVIASLTRLIGRGPDEEGQGADCGTAAYATWEDGISIWVERDRFVGWSLLDADSPLTTLTGIGIGSTLAELRDAMVVDVRETSIGIEFSTGGLAGVLDGVGPDARITHLWAGATCIAR